MKYIIIILTLLTVACVPEDQQHMGTVLELHPEAVKHAVQCYEAMEGPIEGDVPDVDVLLVQPESCTGHDADTIMGCANADYIKLVEGRWTLDQQGSDRFEPGHRLVAHEYMHVLYDTFQPDVPIPFHHDVFSHEMNKNLECNFIPRANTY